MQLRLLKGLAIFLIIKPGSHMILYHPHRLPLSIPNHKEVAEGLLKAQIKRAGITPQEFKKLLSK